MSSFVSLTLALEDWFDKPLCALPKALRQSVIKEFCLMPWDKLSTADRRSAALQRDYQEDPATEQERRFLWDLGERTQSIKTHIAEWNTIATPTASDLALKETRLSELRHKLSCIEAEDLDSTVRSEEVPSGANQIPAIIAPCGIFLSMKKLDASELTISFVGDHSESGLGANNMLEISARKETRRVALAALELVDRRSGSVNSQGVVLLGMANTKNLPHSGANSAKMKRLRDVFRAHLGIKADPFEPYRKSAGWVPRFKIADKRGAADERAKREAERRTDSYEQLNERGDRFADFGQSHQSFDDENEPGAQWLKNNDPDSPA